MPHLQQDLQRLPATARHAALEIGCGPGRLMRPASAFFQEIHGVDISDEMVRLAAEKLADIPHAHVQSANGSDLAAFPDNYFDFVYSYAVFQHIPSRDVVFQYLAEARRVLKPGGILWCQVNGLPQQSAAYTTWEGVRIPAADLMEFARVNDLQLLLLEGVDTQYLWMTCRKQVAGWGDWLDRTALTSAARLRHIHNFYSGDALTPASGRFAAASLAIENLPADCDLNHLRVRIEGRPCRVSFIGPPHRNGVAQVNIELPGETRTGLLPLTVEWMGKPLCPSAIVRVVPAPPLVPVLCSLTDGIDILSAARIASSLVKVTMEEVPSPELFLAAVDDKPAFGADAFCTDPRTRRFEFNFRLPAGTMPGTHSVTVRLGRRRFPPIPIEVV
jgi:SAM-dependent methyltransferase